MKKSKLRNIIKNIVRETLNKPKKYRRCPNDPCMTTVQCPTGYFCGFDVGFYGTIEGCCFPNSELNDYDIIKKK